MKPAAPKPIISEDSLVTYRQQGLSLLSPLKAQVTVLEITTEAQYEEADAMLNRIMTAATAWESRINPIIRPIRAGLDLLYGLRKDILDPLTELEEKVKKAMKAYKRLEAIRIEQKRLADQAEIDKLRLEAEQKAAKEMQAKTKQMRDRISAGRAQLEQALATKLTEAPAAPIKAINSSTRTTRKWRLTDFAAFVAYIMAQEPQRQGELLTLLNLDQAQMNAYYRLEKDKIDIGEWMPGIEVYEDIDITGRR